VAEPAIRPMSLDEFLSWDDGTETRYELIGGFPLAMAPGLEGHRLLSARLLYRLEGALSRRRPCNAQTEAGILHPDRADTFFVADIGVTCAPYDRRRQYMQDPILLIEILSPSTERHDRRIKLQAYQRIATVQEILLLASDERYAEVYRRQGGGWLVELVRDEGTLALATAGIEISISELYDAIDFENEAGGYPAI